jgi:hypothetical protein
VCVLEKGHDQRSLALITVDQCVVVVTLSLQRPCLPAPRAGLSHNERARGSGIASHSITSPSCKCVSCCCWPSHTVNSNGVHQAAAAGVSEVSAQLVVTGPHAHKVVVQVWLGRAPEGEWMCSVALLLCGIATFVLFWSWPQKASLPYPTCPALRNRVVLFLAAVH